MPPPRPARPVPQRTRRCGWRRQFEAGDRAAVADRAGVDLPRYPSSSWMISSARTFGAPVTDPGGKVARMRSASPAAGLTFRALRRPDARGPDAARRPAGAGPARCPRYRPGSGRCASGRRSSRSRRGSWLSAPARPAAGGLLLVAVAAVVPFTGRDKTALPLRRRNSSGDRLATAPRGMRTNAAYGGRGRSRPGRMRPADPPRRRPPAAGRYSPGRYRPGGRNPPPG